MVLVKQIKSANVLENCFDNSDSFFLFIYANWCGHCKDMKPDMEKFKKEVSGKSNNVFIGCIEETDVKKDPKINEVLTKYKIEPKGYPTIVYGKKNEPPKELKGERDLNNFNSIFKELCKQSGGKKSLLSLFKKKRTKRRTKRRTKKRRTKRRTKRRRTKNKTKKKKKRKKR